MAYADIEHANALARDKYWRRRDDGICVKCGKRFADAGRCMCRMCRKAAEATKARNDPDGARHLAWFNNRIRERKETGFCVDCGKKIAETQFIRCKSCRKRRAEYQQVRRIRDRLHGRK